MSGREATSGVVSPRTPGLYLTFGQQFLSKGEFYVFALTTIHSFIVMVIKGLKLFIVVTNRIHFDCFLTNLTFISLVGFYVIIECLFASANFVTNVTLHHVFTMNYSVES